MVLITKVQYLTFVYKILTLIFFKKSNCSKVKTIRLANFVISQFHREGTAETSSVGGREPGGGHGRRAAGVVAARRAAARASAPPVDHQVDGVDHVVGEPRRDPRHHHQQDGEPGPVAGGGRAEGRAAAPHLPLRHRRRRNRGHPCCTPPTRRFHRLAKLALFFLYHFCTSC